MRAKYHPPKKKPYIPDQSRDIQLRLTSKYEKAKDARFKIVACELANGSKVGLDYASLHLGEDVLKYTPTQPGTRALTIKVEVEGGE